MFSQDRDCLNLSNEYRRDILVKQFYIVTYPKETWLRPGTACSADYELCNKTQRQI